MSPDTKPWVVPIRDARTRARHAKAWWIHLLLVGTLVALQASLPAETTARNLVYALVTLSGVLGTIVGIRLHRPRHARSWWYVAAGLGCWFVGTTCARLGSEGVAFWGFWLLILGYPVIAVGLFEMARARAPRHDRAGIIDAWTVALGLGLIVFVFLAQPSFESVPGLLASLQASAFPLGSILLLAGFVRVAVTPGTLTLSARLLFAALGLKLVADLLRTTGLVYGGGQPAWLDTVWLVAWACWGAAALHPSMIRTTEPGASSDTRLNRPRLLLLGLAAALPPAMLVVQHLLGQEIAVWPIAIGSLLIVALVLTRVGIALHRIAEVSQQANELQDQLAFEATHDALTLLPNRAHGLKLLEDALTRARRTRGTTTVMFLDLDGFKLVNDSLGHRAGDQLLRRIGERLQRAVRGSDQAIRLGGDEFVVVMETLTDAETALQVAGRLIATVSQPVHLGPQGTAHVGASIGIAQSTAGGTTAATLLNEADLAAYRAKRAGKGRAEVFDSDMREGLSSQERLAAELRGALDRDELVLHYQPVIDSVTGEVRGYESLVRWQHPTRGLMAPGDFLPLAETSELIADIDQWVLRSATAQLQRWVEERGFDRLVVAVNISPVTAARTRLVDDVAEALELSGLRPDRLVLELPERVLEDTGRTVVNLHRVRALGVSVSIADFGSGLGALARLAALPVNVVKIGRSALEVDTPLGSRLLQLMIQGAHAVGLSAVAEGVERDEQLAALRSLDCEMVQGYHIARPMTADDVPGFHYTQNEDRFSGLLR
ncbi:putative bifunctional diguanylate cyclase/phosphodiesterase [Nocardioides aequoreus]|uniref:putative bifunctional diguanylate cyclase/phosphodiesterase n=1 Tax=Nocardioides aequoreus TaxID=397278 RepID=UPI0004C2FA65|nr:EAL domain-containing protein [Nocardioides aequoreus]